MRLGYLLLLGFALAIASQLAAILLGVSPLLDGRLVDGDCYVHLFRAEALLRGQGWHDHNVMLLNAPTGEVMHWTRPLDFLIALAAWPLSLVLGVERAVWLSGLWVSPLLELLAVAALILGLRGLVPPRHILLAVALFVLQPGVIGVFLAARPDHHALQLAFEIAALAFLARGGVKSAILAGFVSAIALWVGGEALLLVLAAGAFLGVVWIWRGGPESDRLLAYALSLAIGVTFALMVERPAQEWLLAELDRLSLTQVALCWFLALSALWVVVFKRWAGGWRQRSLLAVGMGLQAAGMMALAYPEFFEGPYGKLDPRLVPVWFSLVKEAQPLSFGPKAVVLILPAAAGALFAILRLFRQSTGLVEKRLLLVFLLALLVYVPATFHQVRVAVFAQAASALPWAFMILAAMRLGRLRVLLVPILLTGHLLLAALVGRLGLGTADPGTPDICAWNKLAALMRERFPEDRRPILTYIFPGPELGYLSRHPVIAGPYHRSTDGILDIVTSLGAANDQAVIRVARERKIGWIAVCDRESEGLGFNAKTGSDGFHAGLARGRAPDWLRLAATLSDDKGKFFLYEIDASR